MILPGDSVFPGLGVDTKHSLTKLELISAMALQGFIMRGPGMVQAEGSQSKAIAAAAVHIAKQLIDELNKEQEK